MQGVESSLLTEYTLKVSLQLHSLMNHLAISKILEISGYLTKTLEMYLNNIFDNSDWRFWTDIGA